MSTSNEKQWWASFFDDVFADHSLLAVEDDLLRQTIDFIVMQARLDPGSLLMDQCCGIGRLSLPLARRGIRVIGVDLVESYIKRAGEAGSAEKLPCTFHHGDGFVYVSPEPCDAVINWFSSFGYTPDDQQNGEMVQRAFESLKPGGTFLLDYANTTALLRNFKECILERFPSPKGEVLVLRETHPDLERGMFVQNWTYFFPDGKRSSRHAETRMCMPHTIGEILTQNGFEDVTFFGSVAGESLEIDSPRCICRGTRPEK